MVLFLSIHCFNLSQGLDRAQCLFNHGKVCCLTFAISIILLDNLVRYFLPFEFETTYDLYLPSLLESLIHFTKLSSLLIGAQMVQTEYPQQNLLGSILMFLDLSNRLCH